MSCEHRIGLGEDVHRLEAGRRFVLGGVEVPSDVGPAGHSDGDALLHAITDAVLGACGQGDIGDLFRDDDPAHADADSSAFLAEAVRRAAALGARVVQVDAVVTLERPKLGPLKVQIRESVASMLRLPLDRVGLKAKTAEGLGAVGEGRAIEARAVVLLSSGDPVSSGDPDDTDN